MKLSTLKYSILFIGLIGLNALSSRAQQPLKQPVNVVEQDLSTAQPTGI